MALKVDYKDDVFTGNRKYEVTDNPDTTKSFTDVTVYTQTGDVFSANDINTTNTRVNKNTPKVFSGITVSVTPTALATHKDWDTKLQYGFSAEIAVSGLTNKSVVLSFVAPDIFMEKVAWIADTDADKLTVYTKDNSALSATISLITIEQEEA